MDLGISVGQRISDEEEQQRRAFDNVLANMRVAVSGEIIDFNAEKQTATIQPLIKEKVQDKWEQLPQLLDVPVFFPRAGGYSLTFPVKAGDECLIIFSDMCLDSWWQSGGVQNQLEMRRHDLSDAMALLGITSVPKAVTEYSTDSLRLRNEDNDAYVEITDEKVINVYSVENINVETEKNVNVKAAESVNVEVTENINMTAEESVAVTATNDVSIAAEKKVTINAAEDITINTEKKLSIKSKEDLTIESEKNITIKARKVNIVEDE